MLKLFDSRPQVLVVGAGPVGLYASLTLARRGIEVQVIDEQWRGTTRSYALALHPHSLELLDELGLVEAVLERARRVETIGVYVGPERRAVLDLTQVPSTFPFMAILPQSSLEDLLGAELSAAGVKIRYNHRLSRIESSADSVRATVDRLGKESLGYGAARTETVVESSRELHVPWVLAADGHDSLVRRQLGIKFDAQRPSEEFAVFEFKATGDLPDETRIVLGKTTTDVLWPMSSQRYRWSFQMHDATASPRSRVKDRLLGSIGDEGVSELAVTQMLALIAERAPWFSGRVEDLYWQTRVRCEHRLASSFGKGRTWLAGDAAHMYGPVGVHSMNIGLREARDLCDVYADALMGRPFERGLSAYNHARLAEWRALLDPRESLTPGERAPSWAVDRAGRVLSSIPASGTHMRSLLAQLGLRFTAAA